MNPKPLQPPGRESPKLRLVGDGTLRSREQVDGEGLARRQVALENHASSSLSVQDVRDVLSAAVVSSLEGGRAAILRPQVRRQLVASAVSMGLRPFEANMVIALVQESTRRGEPQPRAMLVPLRSHHAPQALKIIALALAIAAAILAALVAWIKSL